MYFYEAKTFLHLTFEAFFTPYGTGYVFNGSDWDLFFHLAMDAKLTAPLYPVIERLSKEYPIPETLLTRWKDHANDTLQLAQEKQKAFISFLEKAQEENLNFVLFKGAVLAELYGNPLYRISNDTDLYVPFEEGDNFIHFLERIGYAKDMDCSKPEVPVYVHLQNNHRIEVHFSLWEEHNGPKSQLLDSYRITDDDHLISTNVCGYTIKTLRHEDHLLYQLFHMIKHYIVESTNFRVVLDICLFLKKYSSKINFDSLWKKLDDLGYGKFSEVLFYCCIEYMHLDAGDIMKNRIIPTDEDKFFLLEELCKHTLNPVPIEHFGEMCVLLEPYVDGSDAKLDPYQYFLKNQEKYEPLQTHLEKRFRALKELKLTSADYSPAPLAPVHPDLLLDETTLSEKKQHAPYFYRAYGLTVASEIEMSELLPLETDFPKENIDLYIHFSPASESLNHPAIRNAYKGYFWFHTYCCRMLCRNGNEIIIEKKKDSYSDNEIKPFIISHGFVHSLYMRNMISIHSSTVGNESGAITIVGDCGAGKSTYSTLLRHNGYKLIADDVSVITLENGAPTVEIAVPQQKYKVDTALAEGHKLEDLELIEAGRNKYRLLLSEQDMCDEAKPMKGIFEIIADHEENRLEFVKLEGMEAMRMITSNLFCQCQSDTLGGLSVEAFEKLLAIVQQVPVYRIFRPTDRDARQEILDFILSHRNQ